MRMYVFNSVLLGMLFVATSCKHNVRSEQKSVWVKCDTVRVNDIRKHFSFPAQVKAAEEVNMSFKMGGTLSRIFVKEGKSVREGELIAQMDSRDYELQLQAVEGEYLGIKADAERAFALYADSVITQADYDKARYGLQQITAKYENAKKQLADTKLYAPFTGVVKRCIYDPPTVIGAGMPVVTLLSSAMPEVHTCLPVSVYQRCGEMTSYFIKFDYFLQSIPLKVISIASNANVDQLYAVRLALPPTIQDIPPVGLSAMVDVYLPEDKDTDTKIAAKAVFRNEESDYVWLLSDDKVIQRKVVVESLHTDGSAIISSGLNVGEIIVTAGIHNLTEGQQVKTLPAMCRVK